MCVSRGWVSADTIPHVLAIIDPHLLNALGATAAMAAACGALSVLVVMRRWAFIGEGVAHAGFGGVGTAWMLSLAIPAAGSTGMIYAIAIAFCIATAAGIAWLSRRQRVQSDTAIGVFLVAALAWGFIAQGLYASRHAGAGPPGWEDYLMGQSGATSSAFALAAASLSLAVLATLAAFSRHIIAYCFDPDIAEISGVPAGAIHYLLMGLLAVAIVLGMRVMGNLLVTALLVLPGAAAMQASRRLRTVFALSIAFGLGGAVGGTLVRMATSAIPHGPAVAAVLLIEFAAAAVVGAIRRRWLVSSLGPMI